MTTRIARIDSYFSLPTDLAAALSAFPEFVSGEGYRAELHSPEEEVLVSYYPTQNDDAPHVLVAGRGEGVLFLTVLGCVVHALYAHSDSFSVSRWGHHET